MTDRSLGAELAAAFRSHPVFGVAAAEIAGGRLVSAAEGSARSAPETPMTPATPVRTGSFAKVSTAFLACQEAAAGRLDLDQPVTERLAGLKDIAVLDGVSLRHLLSHASGVPDLFESIPDHEGLRLRLGQLEPIAPPGAIFSYSNLGYVLAGLMLETAAGAGWGELVRERLAAPLGLRSLSAEPAEEAAVDHVPVADGWTTEPMWPLVVGMDAAGNSLTASSEDAALLAYALMTGRDLRSPDAAPLLPAQWLAEMQRPQIALPRGSVFTTHWGLGWGLNRMPGGRLHVSHMGGTSVYVRAEPARGQVLAVMSNSPAGADLGRSLAAQRLDVPEVSARARQGPGDLDRFVGEYRSPMFSIKVRREGGRLIAERPFVGGEVELEHVDGPGFKADFGIIRSEVAFLGGEHDGAPPTHLHAALRAFSRAPV